DPGELLSPAQEGVRAVGNSLADRRIREVRAAGIAPLAAVSPDQGRTRTNKENNWNPGFNCRFSSRTIFPALPSVWWIHTPDILRNSEATHEHWIGNGVSARHFCCSPDGSLKFCATLSLGTCACHRHRDCVPSRQKALASVHFSVLAGIF